MAHQLEVDRDGRASFVYNQRNGNPWHTLGTPFDGGISLEDALVAARVRTATTAPLYTMTLDGVQEVPSHQAIVWPSLDGFSTDVLGIVSKQYQMIQYRDVAELAFAVVNAKPDDCILDTMGLLYDGRKFFGYIDFGEFDVTLPDGLYDKHYKGIGFISSHDGSTPITFYKTMIRAVCNNTVTAGLASSRHVVSVKHKSNANEYLKQVPRILGLHYGGDEQFTAIANQLYQVGSPNLEKVIRKIWPLEDNPTDHAKKIWDNRFESIRELYYADSNAGSYGKNGWSMYNTISEYLDHHMGKSAVVRARGSISPTSLSSERKREAAKIILELAAA
jgi:phage/plasmid-like protein (TIGR03299 family)